MAWKCIGPMAACRLELRRTRAIFRRQPSLTLSSDILASSLNGSLSAWRFTGASREMSEALIVNPYDGREMAGALDTALVMPEQEQRERMRLMRQQVREQNVYRWAGRMLVDAARIRQRQRILDLAERAD